MLSKANTVYLANDTTPEDRLSPRLAHVAIEEASWIDDEQVQDRGHLSESAKGCDRDTARARRPLRSPHPKRRVVRGKETDEAGPAAGVHLPPNPCRRSVPMRHLRRAQLYEESPFLALRRRDRGRRRRSDGGIGGYRYAAHLGRNQSSPATTLGALPSSYVRSFLSHGRTGAVAKRMRSASREAHVRGRRHSAKCNVGLQAARNPR